MGLLSHGPAESLESRASSAYPELLSGFLGAPLPSWRSSNSKNLEMCEGSAVAIAGYGDAIADKHTNGRAGGKQPLGNLAKRSPAFSLSAASRKAARKRP